MNSRRKSSFRNIAIAIISEILVTVVCFLFPQAIIVNYGSQANGLITSLQQFIQYFTLLEAGLSGAAVFALYKPLSDKNFKEIERILYSIKRMYSKIGMLFVGIIVVISFIYPYFIADTGYSKLTVTALFCITALNGATQMLFIGKHKVLLNASQNNRYVALLNSASTCLYSVIIIVVAYCKLPLLVAVGLGAIAYIVRALAYYIVMRKLFPQYKFNVKSEKVHFQNQKEVFIQQILSMLILNSGVLILSFTKTDMAEISVYTVYNMVLTAIFLVTNTVNTGVSASFGDLIAEGNIPRLQKAYREYEILFQMFWTVVFSCVFVLYTPFVSVYTSGFTDAIYLRPVLCLLFALLGATWVIRNQQSVIIVAAGKFKEIQKGSIIETVLTFTLSTIGLLLWGLEGFLLGRIIATVYRMIDFIGFNSKHVVKLGVGYTVKQIVLSGGIIVIVYLIGMLIQRFVAVDSYIDWIILALAIGILSVGFSLVVNYIFNKEKLKNTLLKFKRSKSGDDEKI